MTWSLASYAPQGFGVLREDGTLVAPMDLKRWASPMELLEDWPAAEGVLRTWTSTPPPWSTTTRCCRRCSGRAR